MPVILTRCIDYITPKYEMLMALILRGRHVRVNREKYICKLARHFDTPFESLSIEQRNKAYRGICWHYGTRVFIVSFLMTTVPDNLWIVILSCIIDLYLFQCFVFRAMQKIMILYGKEVDLDSNTEAGVKAILSIDRSGVMIGKHPLLQKLKSALGFAAKQTVKKAGPKVVAQLSKSWFMVIRRQLIKWFSVIVARENVHSAFELLIPFTCAVISGFVSVIIFVPMCNKLRKSLQNK